MDTSLTEPSLRLLDLVNQTRAENCSILVVAELSPSLWVDIELEEEPQVGVEHRLVDKVVRSEAGRVTDPARSAIHQLVGGVEAVLVDLGFGREHLQHLVHPAPAAEPSIIAKVEVFLPGEWSATLEPTSSMCLEGHLARGAIGHPCQREAVLRLFHAHHGVVGRVSHGLVVLVVEIGMFSTVPEVFHEGVPKRYNVFCLLYRLVILSTTKETAFNQFPQNISYLIDKILFKSWVKESEFSEFSYMSEYAK